MSALRELREKVAKRISEAEIVLAEMNEECPYLFGPIQSRIVIGVANYAAAVDESLLAILDALIQKEADHADKRR